MTTSGVATLSNLTTVYIQLLLTTNPTQQTFPLNYQLPNGSNATFVNRADLQAELDNRAAVQNEIWGLAWQPTNPI